MCYRFRQGEIPLLISMPHNGSRIPESIASGMTADGRSSRDTDWFLDRLYDVPAAQPSSCLVAEVSRYVVDLNRSLTNDELYPGQAGTGLIPETCFDGSPIYVDSPPNAQQAQERIDRYWQPYHDQIRRELARMVDAFGFAVLLEAHSIASQVPRLFPGVLADFNLGTNRGQSCAIELEQAIAGALERQSQFTHVTNDRFIGGYNTRHYGQPDLGIHAVQIELSQATYLDEARLAWDDRKAPLVQSMLQDLLTTVTEWIQVSLQSGIQDQSH